MTFHVDSEVGQLKQVGRAPAGARADPADPANVDELLFDDVMWAERAREEHDAFVQKLRDKGVTVHLFAELLAEALDQPGGAGVRPGAARRRRPGSARRWSSRCDELVAERRRPHGWPSY